MTAREIRDRVARGTVDNRESTKALWEIATQLAEMNERSRAEYAEDVRRVREDAGLPHHSQPLKKAGDLLEDPF